MSAAGAATLGSFPALSVLTLESVTGQAFRAQSVPSEQRKVVFGGQLLGQMIVAAAAAAPDKTVRTVQAVFARAGSIDSPLDVDVETVHSGRSVACHDIGFRQLDRQICRGLVLSEGADRGIVELAEGMPDVAGPDDPAATPDDGVEGAECRIVDGADVSDPDKVGPPELHVWVRWPGYRGTDQSVHQALTSWWTDPFLIPAALRAVPGAGLGMAHDTLSTGVLQHSLAFHRPIDAGAWNLVTQRVTSAGDGRIYGEGRVFAVDGSHVASFGQWSMIRPMPTGVAGRPTAM